ALSNKGLTVLTELKKKKFSDLPESILDLFWETKLRIIQFGLVNEPKLDETREDLIKKEIFRRYNSGITPLKKVEMSRAKFIYDDLNTSIRNFLLSQKEFTKN